MSGELKMKVSDANKNQAESLQGILYDLIDLALQTKQAHWNVVGPRFPVLHEMLDTMTAGFHLNADRVAERINALGLWPSGQAGAVSSKSALSPLPEGPQAGEAVVEGLSARISAVADSTRKRAAKIDDVVTEGILLDIVEEMEKQRWMLNVQGM